MKYCMEATHVHIYETDQTEASLIETGTTNPTPPPTQIIFTSTGSRTPEHTVWKPCISSFYSCDIVTIRAQKDEVICPRSYSKHPRSNQVDTFNELSQGLRREESPQQGSLESLSLQRPFLDLKRLWMRPVWWCLDLTLMFLLNEAVIYMGRNMVFEH